MRRVRTVQRQLLGSGVSFLAALALASPAQSFSFLWINKFVETGPDNPGDIIVLTIKNTFTGSEGLASITSESAVDMKPLTGEVFIDASALWVDPTPGDSSEFLFDSSLPSYYATANTEGDAAGKADMLSVVLHELGHVLGMNHFPQPPPGTSPGGSNRWMFHVDASVPKVSWDDPTSSVMLSAALDGPSRRSRTGNVGARREPVAARDLALRAARDREEKAGHGQDLWSLLP